MTGPVVSVLMSVYNGERYLMQAIDSILNQTFSDFEFIVINDGSSDGSADILWQYERQDERLRVYHQENRGLIASLNRGLGIARGKYLARMDADDISYLHRLEKQVEIIEQQPDLVILGSAYEVIDELGNSIRVIKNPTNDTAIRWEMMFQCAFAHPSVMLRMEPLRRQRLIYNVDALHAEDYELWSRLLGHGRGMNCSEPLVKRRLHDQRVGSVFAAQQQKMADEVARTNLASLGVELSRSNIRILRQWFGHFPDRLSECEVALCPYWLEILRRFARQPGLEPSVWQPIRGRWIVRIMLARTEDRTWPRWKMRLLSILQPGDVRAVVSYLWRWLRYQNAWHTSGVTN